MLSAASRRALCQRMKSTSSRYGAVAWYVFICLSSTNAGFQRAINWWKYGIYVRSKQNIFDVSQSLLNTAVLMLSKTLAGSLVKVVHLVAHCMLLTMVSCLCVFTFYMF